MMKKPLILLLLGAIFIAGAGPAVARGDNVRIGVDLPYKPMEYQKPDGSLTGFDIDLGNALCKQAGLNCSWVEQSWEGIIPGLQARKFDAIMSSMTINAARRKVLLFSNPYIVPPSAFFVPADSSIKTPDKQSLKDKTIGVQRGTVQDNYVTDIYGGVADINRYASADDVVVDMDTGRLDAAFLDYPTGMSTLLDAKQGKYKLTGKKLTKPKKYFGDGFGIAFRKRDAALAEKFDKALATLKKNGTYQKIYDRYFQSDNAGSS